MTFARVFADRPVCVIIAAWRAEATIARAVTSALAEPEVGEVIVVDDASPDATAVSAQAACDGSGRLQVLRQPANAGPSAARNRAIGVSRAPVIAILDADDFFLPGRIAPLVAVSGWDMIADNIVFIPERTVEAFDPTQIAHFPVDRVPVDLATFVAGNLSHPGRPRGELGFVKPLLRREFLIRHALRYRETMRLGEDYALYVEMLGAGARFLRTARCGYAAVERACSLSGAHATRDLAALLDFDQGVLAGTLLADGAPSGVDAAMLRRHRGQIARRFRHRRFLDRKREAGLVAATFDALADPPRLATTALAILRDKTRRPNQGGLPPERLRYLFS